MNSVERGKNKMPLHLLQKCPLLIIWCIYFQIFSCAYKNITLCVCVKCASTIDFCIFSQNISRTSLSPYIDLWHFFNGYILLRFIAVS